MSACGILLLFVLGTADTSSMIDFELEQLRHNPDWRCVLEAYQAQQVAAKVRNAEHDGWLDRLTAVDGVKDEHLPRIHGKLIALGFLKFELASRSAGVRYQMSNLAAKALNQSAASADDDDSLERAQSA